MRMNYLYRLKKLKYPGSNAAFSPSEKYPEYPYDEDTIAVEHNGVYDAIRSIFFECGLDLSNYGTTKWNPLGEWIKPGQTVLIKPNWVMHMNRSDNLDDLDSLVTHPSIIRCVLDYVLIALRGDGVVYVGDSPVKDCDLGTLLEKGNYNKIRSFYEKYASGTDLKWIDLRGPEEERETVCDFKGILVDLGSKSYFNGYKYIKNLRIPNYDYRKVYRHHFGGVHEYLVNELTLKSDVIINLPKPKTHRKNGMTGAMKNFVGINYSKEYLPHHTAGSSKFGGDEYENISIFKKANSFARQKRDICRNRLAAPDITDLETTYLKTKTKFYYTVEWFSKKAANVVAKFSGSQLNVYEGSWYKNDTLWRTILDLNNIVHYATASGDMSDYMQRVTIHLGDMIISGEGEGPMSPTPVEVNSLLFSTNAVEFDAILAEIMHFDYSKLMQLKIALRDNMLESNERNKIVLRSNERKYCGSLCELVFDDYPIFKAAKGWRGYIEK